MSACFNGRQYGRGCEPTEACSHGCGCTTDLNVSKGMEGCDCEYLAGSPEPERLAFLRRQLGHLVLGISSSSWVVWFRQLGSGRYLEVLWQFQKISERPGVFLNTDFANLLNLRAFNPVVFKSTPENLHDHIPSPGRVTQRDISCPIDR